MHTNLDSLNFLSPAKGPDELGRLGTYRVLKVLGQGGMGVVFLAEDPQLERTVALKAMLPEVAKRAVSRERFLREARATAKIEHDHIVTIYQVGEDRGVPFLAMQLLKGLTLDDYLKKKQAKGETLPVDQILKLGREIARGLAAAHEHGLIHRDIKPANIWLDATAGGRVKILDFGLAQAAEGDKRLTQLGMIVGTPAYMAPEQARSDKVDGRADLFSLGCILYYLCTGRHPWKGADAMETMVAIATEEPTPVQQLNPDLPPKLVKLIGKLLAKKADDRPQSAKAVADAIQSIERDQTAVQVKSPPAASLTSPALAAATVWPDSTPPAGSLVRRTGIRRPNRRRSLLIAGILGGLALVAASAAFLGMRSGNDAVAVAGSSKAEKRTVSQPRATTPTNRPDPTTARRTPPTRLDPPPTRRTPPVEPKDAPPPPVDPVKYAVNSLDMKFARIAPGEFVMGSNVEEANRFQLPPFARVEGPPHRVRITKRFAMGAYPVTVGQFRRFVEAAGYRPDHGDAWKMPNFKQTDDHPVVLVTWNDADAFCKWLTRKEGKTYRLPTEAEWEYCCRAGTRTAYPFGDDPGPIGQYVWSNGNSNGATHPVGQLKPNAWGLYDMPGHIWHWVADWYAPDYYAKSPKDDPPGAAPGDNPRGPSKVMRGGSIFVPTPFCRSASRKDHDPKYKMPHAGFRVVRER